MLSLTAARVAAAGRCHAVARVFSTAAKSGVSTGLHSDPSVLKLANESCTKAHDEDLFAVVHVAGKQHKVSLRDTLITTRLPVEIGTEVTFNKVLLAGSKSFSLIGTPLLDPKIVTVKARLVEHTDTKPMIVFKKKRRKNYRRWNEETEPISVLRICQLSTRPILS